MQKRSTTIFVIGLLTLVLGAATTFAALKGPKKASADTKLRQAAPAAGQPSGFTIPEGKRALAVALDSVAATAGTASKGSRIDVFASVAEKDVRQDVHDTKNTRMILQDIEVLSAGAGGMLANDKAPSTTTTFILAVTPEQAEKIIFHATFSKLWFTVLPAGAKPVPNTPGVNTATQFEVAGV